MRGQAELHPESLISGQVWPQAPRSFFGMLGVPRPGVRSRRSQRLHLVSEVVHPTGLCRVPALNRVLGCRLPSPTDGETDQELGTASPLETSVDTVFWFIRLLVRS